MSNVMRCSKALASDDPSQCRSTWTRNYAVNTETSAATAVEVNGLSKDGQCDAVEVVWDTLL